MATTLTINDITVQVSGTFTSGIDLGTASLPISHVYTDSLANGTAIDQVDLYFSDNRSVVTGTPDNIDLAAVLTSVYGATITFVQVKLLLIKNKSTTAGEILTVGGHATAAFKNWVGDVTDTIKIPPNGMFMTYGPAATAFAVTATTFDMLAVAAVAGTISYDIVILGTSA